MEKLPVLACWVSIFRCCAGRGDDFTGKNCRPRVKRLTKQQSQWFFGREPEKLFKNKNSKKRSIDREKNK